MKNIFTETIKGLETFIVNRTNKQNEINQEVEDTLIENYEATETKTAEIEDAIMELYEMISE